MSETPAAAPVSGAVADPQSNTLAIVGFVLAFLAAPIGIILSAIALKKSGQAGIDNKLAKWGLGLSITFTILGIIVGVLYVLVIAALIQNGDITTTTY